MPFAQSEILNRVRYQSEKRKEIARVMAAQQAESAIKQAEIRAMTVEMQKLADGIAERQESVQKIADEVAVLSVEDTKLQTDIMELLDQLDENGALKPVKLDFPDDKTICWNGKRIPLGRKPLQIVKVLHLAERRVGINSLGKIVWGDDMISHRTIKATISKLNSALKAVNLPYKIISVKRKKRCVPMKDFITGKVHVQTFRSTVVGYKLVPR